MSLGRYGIDDETLDTGEMYSPEIQQNMVFLRGTIDKHAQQMALTNKNPYYSTVGIDNYENLKVVTRRVGFIIEKDNRYYPNDNDKNDAIPILTSLSGLGRDGDLEHLKRYITPVGLTWNVTPKNEDDKFEIVPSGHTTVTNNGNTPIRMDKSIYMEFPPTGGDDKKELIFKEYDSRKHIFNVQNIRKCLQTSPSSINKQYNQNFRETCDLLFTKLLETVLILPMIQIIGSSGRNRKYTSISTKISQLYIIPEVGPIQMTHQDLLKKVMGDPEIVEFFQDLFFPESKTDNHLKDMGIEKYGKELVNNMMMSLTTFQEWVTKFVIGKATSSAQPGKPFNILLNFDKRC
jgi:hypothetical protein